MEIVWKANDRRAGISDEKGPEYAGSDTDYKNDNSDVLANFKRQGRRFAVSPLLAAGIYAGKHIDSFETTVRAIEEKLRENDAEGAAAIVDRGEGFVSRLDDLRNYCDLIECILYELRIHPDARLDRLEEKAKDELVEDGLPGGTNAEVYTSAWEEEPRMNCRLLRFTHGPCSQCPGDCEPIE